MHLRKTTALAAATAMALTLITAPAAFGSGHQKDAEDYCTSQGGNVVPLKPHLYPDTDNDVQLAGTLNACQFISVEDDNPVQLVVDLDTLYSDKPTLAGLAYLAQVPSSDSGPAGSNPAASYCPDDLGGTEAFGTAAQGAWVGELDPGMEAGYSQPLSDVINLCVFADRSAIDDFGLFYAASGEPRGIDLSTVMRYQPDDSTPQVFATDEG